MIRSGEFSAEFVFTSDQAGVTFMCSVDGSIHVPCTSSETEPYIAGPLLPGEGGEPAEHEFEVYAVNQYRNADGEQVIDMSPATYSWSVQDVTPPETFFLDAVEIGPEQFVDPGLRFTFRGVDDLASSFELEFQCAITNTTAGDTPVWEECGEPAANDSFFHEIVFEDYLGSPGDYTFQVRALDFAGNAGAPAPVDGYEFTIEAEPETTILSVTPDMGVDLETTASSVTFEFSGTGATIMCAFDTATFTECTSPMTYDLESHGEHLFEVFAVGALGTPDTSHAIFEFVSGTDVAPNVTINPATAPPATGGTATSGTIQFSSTDPEATFVCVLDGGSELPCGANGSGEFAYSNLLAGEQNPHELTVTATRADLLPSVQPLETIHEWVITDNTPPETTLVAPFPTNPSGNAVDFHFTGTDNGTETANLEFECLLDQGELGDGVFTPCSSPWHIADLTGGTHTFQVRAIDETPAHGGLGRELHVERHRSAADDDHERGAGRHPDPRGRDEHQRDRSALVLRPARLDVRVPAPGELTFDELAPFTTCESPLPPYDLPNGEHIFEVRATTLELNGLATQEEPPAEYTWSIDAADTTDPDTIIELGPADGTTSTSATFLFTGTDNLTLPAALTFECSLDGAPFESCESGDVYTGLSVGDHTSRCRPPTRPFRRTSTAPGDLRVDDRGSGHEQHRRGHERRGPRRRREARLRERHCRRLHLGLDARGRLGAWPAERLRDGRRALLRRLHHGDLRRRRHGVPAVRRARRRAPPPLRRTVGRRHARGREWPDLRRRRQPVAVRGGRGDGRGRSEHELPPDAG